MDALSALADAAANGDDVALARLVQMTHPMVRRICRALCDGDDVDDVVQEVYLRTIRALPGRWRRRRRRAWNSVRVTSDLVAVGADSARRDAHHHEEFST